MTDLRRARADLLAFSYATQTPLAPWQAESLKLEKRITAICAPRQTGKSLSPSVAALWLAFRKSEQNILLVSASEDASRRLLAECAAIAQRSELLKASVVDEFAGLLSLSNKSRLVSVPASERRIRGESADGLIVDEAALIEDSLMLDACLPTVAARPKAKVIVASTPQAPEGAYHDFVEQGDQGSEFVASFHWDLSDATWITPASVEQARESLAPASFAREMLALFTDVGIDERCVERSWIAEAQGRELQEQGEPIYACDPARHGGDESVIVRIAGGRLRVVWAQRGVQNVMTIAGQIQALSETEPGPAPLFYVDADGLGWGVVDRCNQIGGLRVVPFQGGMAPLDNRRHLNKRSECWWAAREAFRKGEVDLPGDDRLMAAQLGQVTYNLDLAGRIVIQPKKQMKASPDRGDAACIALWAQAQAHRGEQIRKLVEQGKQASARERARQTVPTELRWSVQTTTEDLLGGGTRRGGWRSKFDPDLPVIDGGNF